VRKAGQLLAKMEKANGTLKRGKELPQCPEGTTVATLDDLGISKKQSSQWQKLGAMPQRAPCLTAKTKSLSSKNKRTRVPFTNSRLRLQANAGGGWCGGSVSLRHAPRERGGTTTRGTVTALRTLGRSSSLVSP
jgi:hypothetical protein